MIYVFGDRTLDTRLYTLHCAGLSLWLRPKVFQVLTYLLAHREHVSRQELPQYDQASFRSRHFYGSDVR